MNVSDCPSEEELLLALQTRQPAVTAHGQECGRCRTALAELATVQALLAEHSQAIFAAETPGPRSGLTGPVAKVAAVLLLLAGGLAARLVLAPVEQVPRPALRGSTEIQRVPGEVRTSGGDLQFRLLLRPDGAAVADSYDVRVWPSGGGVPVRFESSDNPVLVARTQLGQIARTDAVLWQMRAWAGRRVIAESAPRELRLHEADANGRR